MRKIIAAAAPIANATPTTTDDIYYPNCSAARKARRCSDLPGAARLRARA
jgi:hypothetical protein